MYKKAQDRHCEGCPANTGADAKNPNVCEWKDLSQYPEGRQKVIRLVQRLMHNNPHPWCGFDRSYRLLIVRAAVRTVMAIEHGNEEKYHDSQNQPANFRRSRSGIVEAYVYDRSVPILWCSSVEYLARVTTASATTTEAGPTIRWPSRIPIVVINKPTGA